MSSPTPDAPPPLPGKPEQWAFPTDEKGQPKKKYVVWIALGAAGCLGSLFLVAVLIWSFGSRLVGKYRGATQEFTRAQLQDLRAALEIYAETHRGAYPDSLEALVTPDEHGHTILRDELELPRDAWDHPFVYEAPSADRPLRLYSLGADGQPGGAGIDEDLHASPAAAEER